MSTTTDSFSIQAYLTALPGLPGIYRFYNTQNMLLYVGKAKNLKKRVSSYFTIRQSLPNKTKMLVQKVHTINHIVVESESEALLLENSLIKQYQPKYNILLKDDKSFPWICIKKEPFPRIFKTRLYAKDGAEYFGPYTSALTVNTLLDLFRQLYPLRTCSYLLNSSNILSRKFKICLQYHIGNCKGPCEGLQTEIEYLSSIARIREILKGNIASVLTALKEEMRRYATEYNFEQAGFVKQRIEALEKFRHKSTVVNKSIKAADVFSIIDNESSAYINYLHIKDGALIQSHTVELMRRLDESVEELLLFAIVELRERFGSKCLEVITSIPVNAPLQGVRVITPRQGDKLRLIDLSLRNALAFKHEKLKRAVEVTTRHETNTTLKNLQEDLNLSSLPRHIECFDNSNIQGASPVAACVVFLDGKPAKSLYRHFNIKTVTGPNDFASMEEVVYRRYKRLLEEGKDLPQLVIIDGGKGQLNAALKSLSKLELPNPIQVIGIAKRLEELYRPNDPLPLYLDKKSVSLRLIQQLRNEAHRFGLSFHRDKRDKKTVQSVLTSISGIGDATIKKLFSHYPNIEAIKNAGPAEIASIIGQQKAEELFKGIDS